MRISRWKLLASLVVVALAVGIVATSVFAAPPTPVPGTPSPANPNPNGGPGYGYGMMGGYNLDRVAKLLGMTDADLSSQLQQGKTLVQVAQPKGVTEQQLLDTLMAPIKDQIQLRVKYDSITQAQADSLVQQMTDRVKTAINTASTGGYGPGLGGPGTCIGPGAGGCGGSGGVGGRCGGPNNGTNGPTNNSFGGSGRGMMGGRWF